MAGRVIDATLRFIDNFTRPMQQAMGSLTQNGRTFVNAGKQIEAAGKTIANTGKAMTKAVTVPIVGMGVAAVKTAADFESAMDKVASISGDTGKATQELVSLADEMGLSYKKSADGSASAMDILSAKALQMGAITKFSASEAADAFSYMAMAGWDTQSMMEGIEGIMYLAGATGEDLAATSDIVTDALTAFGMQANETNRFVDVLAQTANRSNTDVAMLGESFKYVAPIAGTLGYSIEDVSVALGLMANSGIKASQAGTSLRTALARIAAPTEQVQVAMDKLGISMANGDGTTKSLMDVMKQLRSSIGSVSVELVDGEGNLREYDDIITDLSKTTEGLTQVQQIGAASTIFGKNAMSGMLAIVNASESDFQKLAVAMEESTGAAKAMYDVANDNLNGQLTTLKSTIESIAITFGNKLLPYIKTGVEKLKTLADVVSNLNDEQVESAIKWAGIAAAIGPAILIFGKVVTLIGKVVTVIGKIKLAVAAAGGVMPLLTGPAGIAIAVVGGLAAAGVLLCKNWDKVKPFLQNVKKWFIDTFGEGIKKTVDGFRNIIGKVEEDIKDKLPKAIESAKKTLQPFVDATKSAAKEIAAGVKNYVKSSFEELCDIVKITSDSFEKYMPNMKDSVVKIAEAIKPTIESIVKAFSDATKIESSVFASIIMKLNASTKKISKTIKGAIPDVIEGFAKALEILAGAVEKVMPFIKKLVDVLGEKFVESTKKTFEFIQTAVGKATKGFEKFVEIFPKAANSIKSMWDKAKTTFIGVEKLVSVFVKNIKATFDESGQTISGFTKKFEGIKEKFSGIIAGTKEFYIIAGAYIAKFGLAIGAVFQEHFGDVAAKAKKTWDDMSQKASEFWQQASPYIEKFGEIAKLVFQVHLGAFIGGAIGLFNSVVNTIVNVVDGIVTSLHGFIEFIVGAFTHDTERALQGFKDMWGGYFQALVELVKTPVNAVIGIINGAISQMNRLGVTIPEWVPKYGGKDFKINLPTLTYLYKGTNNWGGGPAMIHDRGAEIVDLPKGTRVYPHDKSIQMARAEGTRSTSITIPKIADTIIIREEADIDRIMDKMVEKFEKVAPNMA